MATPSQNIYRRAALSGLALLLLSVGLALLALVRIPRQDSGTIWKGYRCLLVEAGVSEDRVLKSLAEAGIREVLSPSTEPVQLSDWSGIETMSLAQAKSRLLPGDPRLDDYLLRLEAWFAAKVKGEEYRVYYIRELPSVVFEAELARGLEGLGGDCILADGSGRRGGGLAIWPGLAATLLLAAVSIYASIAGKGPSEIGSLFRRRGSLAWDKACLRLLACLPWAILAWGGMDAAALAALWGMASVEAAEALDTPIDEFRRAMSSRPGSRIRSALTSLRGQGLPAFGLAIAGGLALFFAAGSLASVALCAAASCLAVIGWTAASLAPDRARRFTPLPIDRPSPRRRASRRPTRAPLSVLACAVILAWCLVSLLAPAASSPLASTAPAPSAVEGSARPLVAEARARAKGEAGSGPPGMAAWLEHLAFQEALPYLRVEEERPDPFAPALLRDRAGSSGRRFDDEWARASYRSIPELSVEGLLLEQGGAVVGRLPAEGGGRGRPLAPIGGLLYIILMVPPIGRTILGIPSARAAASGEIRQEA